ncbi:MAG TPA: DUF2088 domain-containing protein [Desulfonatronum sp.]|nr:DUF2088 domain-containing protein [Desulfonatronum sp.]
MDFSAIHSLLCSVRFPDMALVRQDLENSSIIDVLSAIRTEAVRLDLKSRVRPGQSVAIAVGSRGIDRLDQVVRSLCNLFRIYGTRPFIVPAMGSHGGAAPDGQTEVLASLGVTEAAMNVPIRSCLKVVELGRTEQGIPVVIDAMAAGADHLVIVNRIKAHTKFKAPVESGLMKMLAVGLGNDQGARLVHGLAPKMGMFSIIESLGLAMLAKGNVLCGVGLVENGLGRLHTLRVLLPGEIPKQEPQLLSLAKILAPKLPFHELDVLVVDEIGKDISGTGMDTNITGRNRDILGDFTMAPRIKRIFVRDLSSKTAGNALGIGFADVTTDRVVRTMDYAKTAINCLTSLSPEKAALPMHFPTDRLALAATVHTLGALSVDKMRLVRIRNTRRLDRLQISQALWDELPSDLYPIHGPKPLCFVDENLAPFEDDQQPYLSQTDRDRSG